LITVPTNPKHSSLNLAQAVLLIAYELRMAAEGADAALPTARRSRTTPLATTAELNAMFDDAERALAVIDFFKKRQPAMIMRGVRAAARRASLNQREVKLLRAISIEVRKFVERIRDK